MSNKVINNEHFLVVGANHRSSTMLFRDKLAIRESQLTNVYDRLVDAGIEQSFILSTTDRTEIYVFQDPTADLLTEIIMLFSAHAGVGRSDIEAQTYILKNSEAFRHLLAVCCGLDSLVIGDLRIKDVLHSAYNQAKHRGMIGAELDFLVSKAFTASKRLLRETRINRHPVSIPAAVTQVARDLHGELTNCTGLLIGTGEMGEMLATSLVSTGLAHLVAIHPNLTRAESIAQTLNCHVGRIEDLPELLEKSDIVLTSMNSRRFTLTRDAIKTATTRRRRKPILIIDTGVPGDVDFSTTKLRDAFLYSLDDLEKVTREGMATREIETENAWNIVQAEVNTVFSDQEESIKRKQDDVSETFVEALRQKALADAFGDADKATKLFFQSLKKHEKKSAGLINVERKGSDK